MSNPWFQFKQFTIFQDKCAMKVCTDACIFGAYISAKERAASTDETNILDIGTGTGLLPLMIAQEVKGTIEAVEIDKNAYEQAEQNFRNSLWKQRLSASLADITKFELNRKYDIIISNPPFYENSLKSNNKQRNIAKHATSLPYAALASIVYANLTDQGRFYILLPVKEFEVFEKIANENQLALTEKINVRPTVSSGYFRSIGVFTKAAVEKLTIGLLTIKNNKNEYTAEFIQLLKDYYLYL